MTRSSAASVSTYTRDSGWAPDSTRFGLTSQVSLPWVPVATPDDPVVIDPPDLLHNDIDRDFIGDFLEETSQMVELEDPTLLGNSWALDELALCQSTEEEFLTSKTKVKDIMDCTLHDLHGLEEFEAFLQTEFATEAMEFVRAVDGCTLKELQLGAGHPEVWGCAKTILDEYVAEGAPNQINISAHQRNKIQDGVLATAPQEEGAGEVAAAFSSEVFREACREVCKTMQDNLGRFLGKKGISPRFHKMEEVIATIDSMAMHGEAESALSSYLEPVPTLLDQREADHVDFCCDKYESLGIYSHVGYLPELRFPPESQRVTAIRNVSRPQAASVARDVSQFVAMSAEDSIPVWIYCELPDERSRIDETVNPTLYSFASRLCWLERLACWDSEDESSKDPTFERTDDFLGCYSDCLNSVDFFLFSHNLKALELGARETCGLDARTNNSVVRVVWVAGSERRTDMTQWVIDTCPAVIVIHPLSKGPEGEALFRVDLPSKVHSSPGRQGPLVDGCVVSLAALPILVRQTAIFMHQHFLGNQNCNPVSAQMRARMQRTTPLPKSFRRGHPSEVEPLLAGDHGFVRFGAP